MIGRYLHPLLPRPVPDPRPAPILSPDRDGQGHRDHGAPPPGAYPRAPTQCARRLPPCGSGDPRRPLAVAGAMALALLPRHARDAPLLAPRALEAQMAALAIHAWPWSAAHVRRARRAHRPDRPREPALGLCPHPGRASRPRHSRLGELDPPGTSPTRSRSCSPQSPSWRQFLATEAKDILVTDLFTVDTVYFTQLYVLFVIELKSRAVHIRKITDQGEVDAARVDVAGACRV